MASSRHPGPRERLPRLAAALLGALLPLGERDEVMDALAEELGERRERRGGAAARAWLWRQVLLSLPPLLRRSWWRGWSGFEPRANRLRPGGPVMESWIMDARFAARRLRARPAYTLLAVLTLALGVGGTAAIYGIAKTLLLDPLPYAAEEDVAVFWNPFDWSEAEMVHFQDGFPGFWKVAGYRTESVALEPEGGAPRLVPGLSSSAGLFEVLGVRPWLGSGFAPGSDRAGAEPSAVLSHELWQELGGDPAVVGKRIRLDGVARTVTGVMPRGFWFPDPSVRVWLAEELDPENRSGNYALVGRMPPGQDPAATDAALRQIAARLGERFDYPAQWDKTRNPSLTPLRESLVGPVRPALLATWAAMAVILLMACANVAALMLGQVDGQATELSVRAALGAGWRRLVQQLVAEALLLGVLAGVAGAVLAAVGFRLLRGALPLGALAEGASLDWTVFAAAMGIALLASLGVALVPSFSLWRSDLQRGLSRSRTQGVAGRGGRIESTLVVAEVALAVLVAAGAALLVRSVANLRAIDPGIDRDGIAVVDVATAANVPEAERLRIVQGTVDALGALPGVAGAAAVQRLPLRGSGDSWGMEVEGREEQASSTTYFRVVTRDYFATLGIPLRRGRAFAAEDRAGAEEPVVVINEALASKYFPGEDPLGRRIASGTGGWARVVGVVGNVAEANLTDGPEPARYMLAEQVPYTPEGQTLVLRVRPGGDPAAVLESARQAIRRVAPGVAVQRAATMEEVFTEALGPARQVMSLLALLGGLALVLGAVGVYGIVSHFVTRRRRDWGIRMALGLRPARVIGAVVRRGGVLVGGGIVLGLVGFLGAARWLASFLYGVGAADPLALLGTTAVLMLAGLAAALVPAWRASRIEPAVVLRES